MDENSDEKISELWALVNCAQMEKDFIKEGLEKLSKESGLKTEIKWEHYVFHNYRIVLKMNSEALVNKSSYASFLRKLCDMSHIGADYTYSKPDRAITQEGLELLDSEDKSPLGSMGLYLLLVKECFPQWIIQKTEQFDHNNLNYLDKLCQKKGYVVEV